MNDQVESVEATATATETAAPVTAAQTPVESTTAPEAEAVEEKAPSIRESLEKAFDKLNAPERDRDERGRFVSANGEPEAGSKGDDAEAAAPEEPEQITGDQPEETEVEQASKPAIDPPVSWSREAREGWAKLPPETQEYIANREREAHHQITQLGQVARQFEPFAQVLEQYRDDFQRRNVDPAEGFAAMLNVQRSLDANPYTAIQQIAGAYGVDLSIYGNVEPGSESGPTPEVAGLLHQVQTLQAEIQNIKQSEFTRAEREAEIQQQTVATEIDAFLSTHEINDEQMGEMADYIGYLTQTKPHLSAKEKLDQAYKRIIENDPRAVEERLRKQQAAEAAKKAEEAKKKASEAKKAASLNVKGSSANTAPRQFKSLREELEYAYDTRAAG
jgi:hypothetical protein